MLRFTYVLIFLGFASVIATAQNSENSPYSRYGLGNLADPFLAHQGMMGGWSAAFHDPHFINYKNPASFGSLKATSFEVGLFAKNTTLTDDVRSTNQWGGNLSYFSLAFPIKNPLNDAFDRRDRKFFWGTGLTLIPYTDISYNITTTDFQQNIGRVTRQFTGEGGTYRLLLTNGWKYNNFSWGVNTGIIFGKLERNRVIFLDDFTNHSTDLFEETQVLNAFTFDAGFQYDFIFNEKSRKEANKPRKYITIGAYGNANQGFRSEATLLSHRVNSVVDPFIRDTIFREEGVIDRGTLPLSITAGIAYGVDQKIKAGIDYTMTRWSSYENPLASTTLFEDTWSINGGIEYIPNASAISNYLRKIRYRAGFRAGSDPRVIGEQLRYFEISTGFGLPFVVSREVSQLHIGVTYGRFGGNAAPINESYFRINFGYTFLDNTWFVKRRFY